MNNFISNNNLSDFFEKQLSVWDLVRNNYSELAMVEQRFVDVDGFKFILQHNTARIKSTAAKLDKKSIDERKCFLCRQNRPMQQSEVHIFDKYELLVNPYPIFPKHFTIAACEHMNQDFANFDDMALIAQQYKDYVVFYNGSQAGASAPDHLHYQMGNKDFLPLCSLLENKRVCKLPMRIIHFETSDFTSVGYMVNRICDAICCEKGKRNILMWQSDNTKLQVAIFPRTNHRPKCYYATEGEKMLVSPGAIDMAGIFILPRKEDFERMTSSDIIDVFNDVTPKYCRIKEILETANIENINIY